MRLANAVRGLARLGEIDLFVIAEGVPTARPTVPPGVPVDRLEIVAKPVPILSMARRVWWLTSGTVPKAFLGRDYRGVRSSYNSWKAKKYDLAWLFRIESYVALPQSPETPTIVDLDDLEDYKTAARLALKPAPDDGRRLDLGRRLRRTAADIQARRDVGLLKSLHARIAQSVDAVVVCKEMDRQRLGEKNIHVIPNGYEYQHRPVGRTTIGDPPVIMFPALLTYAPNADGAAYLVREIAPLIREKMPTVQVRLVGRANGEVQALHDSSRIVVTGFVPDIKPELAMADLIVVPVRYGGGTRIKILEAFAHRIPVVSTTMGVEGIEATPGRDILLADSAEDFAEACVSLLNDTILRQRMVEAAHQLFLAKYRWDHIQNMVASLAASVARRTGALPDCG